MPSARAYAVAREEGHAASDQRYLRVDTYRFAPEPMRRFVTMNPYHRQTRWTIPVPGTDLTAQSVESVWQGLKVVNGCIDTAMFYGEPAARPGRDVRGRPDYRYDHSLVRYGALDIDIVSARLVVYLPTYLYLLKHLANKAAIDEIDAALRSGRDVLFYDWDANMDPLCATRSWSHSAILAAWFNGELESLLKLADGRRRELAARLCDRPSSHAPLPPARYTTRFGVHDGELGR